MIILDTLKEKDWELLLGRIKDGECTPFLGAGACFNVLPLGAKIANEWAQKWHYPLIESRDDLARVSQFLAIEYDPVFPKQEIRNLLKDVSPPNFKELKSLMVCLQILFTIYMSKIIRLKGE